MRNPTVPVVCSLAAMLATACAPGMSSDQRPPSSALADDNAGECVIPVERPFVTDADSAAYLVKSFLINSDCGEAAMKEAEGTMFDLLEDLDRRGILPDTLLVLAREAVAQGTIPAVPEETLAEKSRDVAGMIEASLCAHGRARGCESNQYEAWAELTGLSLARTPSSATRPDDSRLRNPDFIAELANLADAGFLYGNQIEPLIDGEASFARRDPLLEGAQQSIYILTWAIYDDTTGQVLADQLRAARDRGVEVKIVVDAQTSWRNGYGDIVAALETEPGIEVIRWREADPAKRFNGMHRKLLIVDGEELIAGGMNFGDWYSHKGPANTAKWRDTDVSVRGPAVRAASEIFANVWNEQVASWGLNVWPVTVPPAPATTPPVPVAPRGGSWVAVVDHAASQHRPGSADAPVRLSTLKAIEGAGDTIEIENAYLILPQDGVMPAGMPGDLEQALLDAIARGVNVRILTNSAESIDEPIMTAPILASLGRLIDAGAEIALKKGDTLHSKLIVVDGVFSWVGSYNLHPRSQRYEGELAVEVLDEAFAAKLHSAFELDFAAGTRLWSRRDVPDVTSPITVLATRYFFDLM